jgi:hypothetical protein
MATRHESRADKLELKAHEHHMRAEGYKLEAKTLETERKVHSPSTLSFVTPLTFTLGIRPTQGGQEDTRQARSIRRQASSLKDHRGQEGRQWQREEDRNHRGQEGRPCHQQFSATKYSATKYPNYHPIQQSVQPVQPVQQPIQPTGCTREEGGANHHTAKRSNWYQHGVNSFFGFKFCCVYNYVNNSNLLYSLIHVYPPPLLKLIIRSRFHTKENKKKSKKKWPDAFRQL